MTYYLYRRPDGLPEQTEFKLIPEIHEREGYFLIAEGDEPFDLECVEFHGDRLVKTVEPFKRREKKYVDIAVEKMKTEPVEYDGTVIDADPVARRAITDKLTELDVRTPPQAQLYWRDRANQHRMFQNQADYRAFLRGALAAIAKRDADAVDWGFAQKAAIDAATTPEGAEAVLARPKAAPLHGPQPLRLPRPPGVC